MTAVHQLLPTTSPHDAITGQAFAWRGLLREWGYESEIMAEHVHSDSLGCRAAARSRGQTARERWSLALHYALWSATVKTGRPPSTLHRNPYAPSTLRLCLINDCLDPHAGCHIPEKPAAWYKRNADWLSLERPLETVLAAYARGSV
jgi:hypothetical protein